MRICVVGPSYPFRGGIAHYTSLLCESLKSRHSVKLFSLKRQYPSLLFPGRTQIDASNTQIRVDGAEAVLDSMNPASWVDTARRIRQWKPDVLLLQWWHPFFCPSLGSLAAMCHKRCRVLFLCHNVLPHERRGPTHLLTKMALRYGHGFIVHSEEDLADLRRLLPDSVVRKALHPTYEVFRLKETDKEQARRNLGVRGRVILFFGLVRGYKGLRHLIEAMPYVREQFPDAILLIAGEFYDDKAGYLAQIESLGVEDVVVIHDRYVPNEQVADYFTAADVVVLPYTSATQSGIVQIAFGFCKPVITTNVGGLPEAVKDGVTGILVPPADPTSLAGAIVDFFHDGRGNDYSSNIAKTRDEFSWDRMVETVESLASEVQVCSYC